MDKVKTAACILIVEDNAIIAYGLQKSVTKLGYNVVGAVPSGEEAIQKVGKERPDLVLMDINLAGALNGIETATQIRARFDIPIIYLTGYAEDMLQQEIGTSELYVYLSKPVTERGLHDTIEMVLSKYG